MPLIRLALACVALLAGLAGAAAAQPAPGRLELWLGAGLADARQNGTYTTRFAPRFDFFRPTNSSAGQALALEGARALGAELGGGWFPSPRFGVRVAGGRFASDLGGTNTPYAWNVRFISLPPPANTPREVALEDSIAWPDSAGRLEVFTLSASAVARFGVGERLSGSVSGGVTGFRMRSRIEPLGYTTFHLGGHSTFFSQEYELAVALESTNAVGWNAGADLELSLGRRVWLRADFRYLHARERLVPPLAISVLNADQILLDRPLAAIEADLALRPVALDPSFSRLSLGLVFRP